MARQTIRTRGVEGGDVGRHSRRRSPAKGDSAGEGMGAGDGAGVRGNLLKGTVGVRRVPGRTVGGRGACSGFPAGRSGAREGLTSRQGQGALPGQRGLGLQVTCLSSRGLGFPTGRLPVACLVFRVGLRRGVFRVPGERCPRRARRGLWTGPLRVGCRGFRGSWVCGVGRGLGTGPLRLGCRGFMCGVRRGTGTGPRPTASRVSKDSPRSRGPATSRRDSRSRRTALPGAAPDQGSSVFRTGPRFMGRRVSSAVGPRPEGRAFLMALPRAGPAFA